MAIVFEANYSKKLGLPGYSSHQYQVTVRVEMADITQVPQESERLYGLLQSCVDREIQQTGFLPLNGYNGHNGSNGNGSSPVNGNRFVKANAQGQSQGASNGINGTNGMGLWIRFFVHVMMYPLFFHSPHITIPIRFCMS